MQFTVAHIGAKSKTGAKSGYESLTRLYLDRIAPYYPIQSEVFRSEADFLDSLSRSKTSGKAGRVPAIAVLLDSRGKQLSSADLATWIGVKRDQGAQHMVFAIGPADGWSETTRGLAPQAGGMLLSFGPITLPHELARLVLAEQLYRACTILAGHPYHSGH